MAPVDSGELQAVPANDLGRRSGSRSRRIGVVPEPKMSVPRSVAEVLAEHVTLEVEGIDRMYLNVYIPGLQREQGVACFFRFHRGHQFASSALMDPISKTFVAALEAFARQEWLTEFAFYCRAKSQPANLILKQHRDRNAAWRKWSTKIRGNRCFQ